MKPIPPLRIVLSGGGVRGLAYVGVFLELEKLGFLKNLNEVLGVSCGALFGFAYTLGYSPNELNEFVELFDFSLIQNIEPETALQYFYSYGIDNGYNLERLLESILKNKGFSKNITFIDHYNKTKMYFRCFATNILNCKYHEFSYKITPNVLLIDALIASMSIPGYFIPKVIENNMYSDGGIINNFPLDLIKHKDIHTTLGFTFSEDHTNINTIKNVVEFFSQIYACTYLNRKQQILTRYKENIIIIGCGDYPLWNFNAPKEDRLELIAIGRKAVQDFYTLKQFSVKPVRRYSVS